MSAPRTAVHKSWPGLIAAYRDRLPVEDGMRKGPVSDVISRYFGSIALDSHVGVWIAP